MTSKNAMRLEAHIKKLGNLITGKGMIFHELVRKFRMEGAWACTNEHHRTFGAWCKWMGPQIKMSANTLASYGSPNYKSRYARAAEQVRQAGDNITSMNVSGLPGVWLRRACDHAHKLGVPETRRGGTENAIIAVSKFFLHRKKLNILDKKTIRPSAGVRGWKTRRLGNA